ncbi:MAG TPA: hypothetical protein PLA94_18365 [Myxococcota bacterium]|nr:hypothetical protein [Myxococcota bacterium]
MNARPIAFAELPPLATSHRYDGLSLREARSRFFAEQGIPADGGYDAKVVPIYFGKLHIWDMPNVENRKKAVRFHDLHHVIAGYPTDWSGEGRISAWEISSGCARYPAALWINLHGIGVGLFTSPVGTFRALVRGGRSGNLYPTDPEAFAALEERKVEDVRADLNLDQDGEAPTPKESLRALGILAGSSLFSLLHILPFFLLLSWVWTRLSAGGLGF